MSLKVLMDQLGPRLITKLGFVPYISPRVPYISPHVPPPQTFKPLLGNIGSRILG